MKLHYLFSTRYDVNDENSAEDWRHRNAVFGVHSLLSKRGYDIQYHYHNEDMLQSMSLHKNDIAITLHPQNPSSINPLKEARADGARCGVFLDFTDMPYLCDPTAPIWKALQTAHFAMVPNAVSAQMISQVNRRAWVVPPLIENSARLPFFNLQDVKLNKRPLRITSLVEPDQQAVFIHLLSSMIQTAKKIYPIDLDIYLRLPTGFAEKPDIETFRQTVSGIIKITANKRIRINMQNFNKNKLVKSIEKSDIQLIAQHDDPLSGNIQQPLWGINAGILVMIPAKSKVYGPLYSMGSVPYQPEELRTVLAGLVMDPRLHMTGRLINGQNIIRQHHTPEKLADHFDMIFRNELHHHRKPVANQVPKPNFWQAFQNMEDNSEVNLPLSILQQHPHVSTQLSKNDEEKVFVREISKV